MEQPILLLDGGFSNELSKRCSYDVDKDPLWTARALLTDKKAVIETHLEYLKAGVDIIETATYQATTKGLEKYLRLPQEECERLIENAVILADESITQFKRLKGDTCKTFMIAGSIGPYGVYLNDGSEYSGNYMEKVDAEEIISVHSKRLEILGKHSKVDVLAVETMPSFKEFEILLRLMKEKGIDKPVWVSFMLQNDDPTKTARGESVVDAFKAILQYDNIWGFGTNCVNPQNVNEFLRLVAGAKRDAGGLGEKIRIIVYPNLGKTWTSGVGWSKEIVPEISTYAKTWVKLGANIIGGCCQVGPEQIQKLASIIKE